MEPQVKDLHQSELISPRRHTVLVNQGKPLGAMTIALGGDTAPKDCGASGGHFLAGSRSIFLPILRIFAPSADGRDFPDPARIVAQLNGELTYIKPTHHDSGFQNSQILFRGTNGSVLPKNRVKHKSREAAHDPIASIAGLGQDAPEGLQDAAHLQADPQSSGAS